MIGNMLIINVQEILIVIHNFYHSGVKFCVHQLMAHTKKDKSIYSDDQHVRQRKQF